MMYRTIAWCVATGLVVFLVLSPTSPSSIAAPDEKITASVEYKAVPASEFGMNVKDGEGTFDYSDMAKKLNKLAADGWHYRDFIKAADGSTSLSVVLLERRR